jgi:putative flavoprotein involved in K+ transport
MLADGTVLDVANVIWCTGFRPDYGLLYSFTSMPVIGAGRDAAYVVERIARRRRMRDPARVEAAGLDRRFASRLSEPAEGSPYRLSVTHYPALVDSAH